MTMLRGKIESEREILPKLIVVNGISPFHKDDNGKWVSSNPQESVRTKNLRQFLGRSFAEKAEKTVEVK